MTNTEMLERKIEEKGIKIEFLAANLGVPISDLLLKIRGEEEFLVSELWIVSKMLELEANEVEEIFLI